jgi:hypothetical protein
MEWDPTLARFFRSTVVPDELFFQSLVASWLPGDEVQDRHLTLYQFTEAGVPVTFYDGHEDFLAKQPFFFARKLSPRATHLRDALDRNTHPGQDPVPRDLEDQRVGRTTDDYERFVRVHRTGLWGQRCWGRPGTSALGELERLKTPYFVLLAHGPGRLLPAREAVPRTPDWICHGTLFDPERPIQLTARIAAATGYGPDSQALRDQDRPAFLAEVLRCSAGQAPNVGWMLTAPRPGALDKNPGTLDLLRLLATDPNCHFVHIAAAGEHRDLRQALHRDCPKHLGLQTRAKWIRVNPRTDQSPETDWLPTLRSALDARHQACERRHRAQLDGQAKPRLTLHIGIHRTGTTALQRALSNARQALADQDVHYAFDTVNHNFIAEGLRQDEDTARGLVHQVIEEGLDSGKGHVIISAENLAALRDPATLWDLQRHFDVQVLAYLRRQDRWLESWYNQAIRWPWNADIARLDPKAFYRRNRRFHWLDYRALHDRWSKVFGTRQVQFRNFESARTGLLADFVEAAGLPDGVLEAPTSGVNASASPRVTEALRHLHLMGRTDGERGRLVAAVRKAYEAESWTGPPCAFSPAQRRKLLQRHRRSNDWVARELFHRESPLFADDWPGRDRTLPDVSLPDASSLLSGLGGVFLEPWLDALPQKRPLMTLPETQRRRLVALLRRKLGAPGIPDQDSPTPVGNGTGDDRYERFYAALGIDRLPGSRQAFADTALAAWALRPDVPRSLPVSSERLLAECFGPLSEECETLLTIEVEARQWIRGNVDQRLAELERTLR